MPEVAPHSSPNQAPKLAPPPLPSVPPPPPAALSAPPALLPPEPDRCVVPPILSSLAEPALDEPQDWSLWLLSALPGMLLSAVVHFAILIALGMCVLATRMGAEVLSMEWTLLDDDITTEMAVDVELPLEPTPPPPAPQQELIEQEAAEQAIAEQAIFAVAEEPVEPSLASVTQAIAGGNSDLAAFGTEPGDATGFAGGVANGSANGGASDGLAARTQRRRQALYHGATPESENAVDLALDWIVRHQRDDGSWCFDHTQGNHRCVGCACNNIGRQVAARNGATALGLLPLLGAGHTHLEGDYRREVARGLRYLISQQENNGSFLEPQGNMYSHGLASLALCEALAMTPQKGYPAEEGVPLVTRSELKAAAQRAIHFIEQAQHTRGGWRYTPKQPGDTSVVGWQLMALKSGQMAELDVSPSTFKKASKFLDAVADDRFGSCYGYTTGQHGAEVPISASIGATTPIGLLCRMYTGWERKRAGIALGVERLDRWARPGQGMYYNYYATQVMRHYGGGAWDRWNGWMRDHLVKSQADSGSEKGSWQFTGPFDESGRLYCTAMSAMTLEVYYRHSPIYGEGAVAMSSRASR